MSSACRDALHLSEAVDYAARPGFNRKDLAAHRTPHPHPSIRPPFEADDHEIQPYLVFEHVDGQTPAQAQRGPSQLPARDAANRML